MPEYERGNNNNDYSSDDGPRIVPFKVRTNIDWINEAPFGLICKAHKLLNSGLSQQELVIKAHKISMDEGCQNFAERLPATDVQRHTMAEAYAKERGFDVERCYELMLKYNKEKTKYDNC